MLRAVSRAAEDLRRRTGIPGGREGPPEEEEGLDVFALEVGVEVGGAVLNVPRMGRAEPATSIAVLELSGIEQRVLYFTRPLLMDSH